MGQNLIAKERHCLVREQFKAITKNLKPTNLTLKKYEIVHALAKKYNYQSYLEICTPTTGNYFCKIDQSKFKKTLRLMYNCSAEFDDGLPIDYRLSGLDISSIIKATTENKLSIDVCLVDSWHTYDNSFRDLRYAYDLLTDGGAMVVHDCLPTSLEFASPNFKLGPWTGVSYKAYVDFLLANKLSDYFTVDTDYGCGIIYKERLQPFADEHKQHSALKIQICEQLAKTNGDYDRVYQIITENRAQLLNLISVNQFLKEFGDTVELPRKVFLWLSSPAIARLNLIRWRRRSQFDNKQRAR